MCDYINYKFYMSLFVFFFFFSSRRRHTRFDCDWSSDVCSSDLDGDCATGSDIQVMLAGHGDFITRWIAITFAGDGRETASHGVPSLSSCQSLRDRKSTRLNSSHSQISYAVFCLKKKKHSTAADL